MTIFEERYPSLKDCIEDARDYHGSDPVDCVLLTNIEEHCLDKQLAVPFEEHKAALTEKFREGYDEGVEREKKRQEQRVRDLFKIMKIPADTITTLQAAGKYALVERAVGSNIAIETIEKEMGW